MKCNTVLLTNQVRNKLTGKCVTAIVTEAFINALPFDKSELAAESANLSRFAVNVVEKMHPETLLDRAVESTMHNPKANLYVQNLKTAIEGVVQTATRRVVNEAATAEGTPAEIVAKTKLNSDETEQFVNASKQSGIDAVAKLVKEKMIDVIKDEKASYEAEAKLRQEVKDIIKQENETLNPELDDDSAIESYFELVLAPTDARSHISVFSKMQDVCMEAVMHSNEEYTGEIPYKTLEKITLESTFPYFDLSNRSVIDDLESMVIITESMVDADCAGEEIENKKKKVAKTAFICTICIMTLLETLKTMHLAKPEVADIKNFVDDATAIKNIAKNNLDNIEDKVGNIIGDVKKSAALGSFNTLEVAQAKEGLSQIKTMLEKWKGATESETAKKDRILNKINSAIEAVSQEAESKPVDTGYFATRLRNENITNVEHGVKMIAQKPIVHTIQICLRSDLKCTENSKVDVEIKGVDASGACVATYMIQIHALPDFGNTVAEVIRDCANYCDFGPKVTQFYFTDTGYAAPLKA